MAAVLQFKYNISDPVTSVQNFVDANPFISAYALREQSDDTGTFFAEVCPKGLFHTVSL